MSVNLSTVYIKLFIIHNTVNQYHVHVLRNVVTPAVFISTFLCTLAYFYVPRLVFVFIDEIWCSMVSKHVVTLIQILVELCKSIVSV